MSGKHQRRFWVLPVPTGSTSRYDRMQIGVGRANSTNISIEHDTLIKTLLDYILQQDTFIKAITNIQIDTDTLINVFVNFNYEVNHDTLIRILSSIQPVSEAFGGGGRQTIIPPFSVYKEKKKKKKKKADEIIKLEKLDLSKVIHKKNIQIRIDTFFEAKLKVGDVKLLTEQDIQNLTVLNVEFVDISDKPIEVNVFAIEEILDANNKS
jgi:hypothetical protein